MTRTLILFVCLALPGCASWFRLSDTHMKEFSVGKVGGCMPNEIAVSDYTPSDTGSYCGTWRAVCQGKRYICARTPDGKGGGDVSCSPTDGGPSTAMSGG